MPLWVSGHPEHLRVGGPGSGAGRLGGCRAGGWGAVRLGGGVAPGSAGAGTVVGATPPFSRTTTASPLVRFRPLRRSGWRLDAMNPTLGELGRFSSHMRLGRIAFSHYGGVLARAGRKGRLLVPLVFRRNGTCSSVRAWASESLASSASWSRRGAAGLPGPYLRRMCASFSTPVSRLTRVSRLAGRRTGAGSPGWDSSGCICLRSTTAGVVAERMLGLPRVAEGSSV